MNNGLFIEARLASVLAEFQELCVVDAFPQLLSDRHLRVPSSYPINHLDHFWIANGSAQSVCSEVSGRPRANRLLSSQDPWGHQFLSVKPCGQPSLSFADAFADTSTMRICL